MNHKPLINSAANDFKDRAVQHGFFKNLLVYQIHASYHVWNKKGKYLGYGLGLSFLKELNDKEF